jgi:hypothetical protein
MGKRESIIKPTILIYCFHVFVTVLPTARRSRSAIAVPVTAGHITSEMVSKSADTDEALHVNWTQHYKFHPQENQSLFSSVYKKYA